MAELGIETAKLVGKRVLDEVVNFVWGSRNDYQRLKGKLESVQPLLVDLSTNKNVKNVAYSADNLVDDYAYESLRMEQFYNNNKCLPPSLLSCFYKIKFHFQMYSKVKEILEQFDEIDKEAQSSIGLKTAKLGNNGNSQNNNDDEGMMSSAAWNQAREHATYNSGFVGREKDVEDLLDMLLHPHDINTDNGLSTVAIVGMGGLGKTTLARRLFDHDKIDAHFGNKCWIKATDFDLTKILKVAESVTQNNGASSNKMKGSKILVVLDDVWNQVNGELWDSLKGQLRRIGVLPGSVILVTTRQRDAATKGGAASPHMLKPLSPDQSWEIVLKSSITLNGTHMSEVVRRIIEKCNGLPLAIKVMVSLLKSNHRPSEWEEIERSEIWDLAVGQNEILPSLLLSFKHLPSPSLKQCFAYYAVIPKGRSVCKNEIVGLWLSQGYLREDKGKSMEDIGEEYIKILVGHSLLEEYEPGMSIFIMHDLVHDLAAYVSRDEFGFRDLAFRFDKHTSTSDFPADEHVVTMFRTLYLSDSVSVQWHWLKDARYLRTLFLECTGITELPSEIERLKHLRYLNVSYNPISTLPDSIGKLYQLETLILKGCNNMRKLPKVLNTLVSLRHILTTDPMYAWKGLRRLSNLKTLPHLCLDDDGDGWSIDELGDFDGLRDEIYIDGLQCVKNKEQARKAGLAGKAKVTKLTLSWDEERQGSICNDEDVLDGLEPHPNITSLEVNNFNGERFPTWVTRMAVLKGEQRCTRTTLLGNLTVVKLEGCFRCQTLPTLGQLPLECLVLDGFDVECIGKEFYGGDDSDIRTAAVTFRNLKELEVSRLNKLTTWTAPPQDAFPRLEILQVTECPLLESVPAGLGSKSLASLLLGNLNCMRSLDIIKYSTCLTSLEMSNMPEIRSLPEELANCTKLTRLRIQDLEKLECLPSGGLTSFVSLQSLNMTKCPMMEAATTDVSNLVLVSWLEISCNSLQHLRTLLQVLEHLPRLSLLSIYDIVPFEKEDEMRDYLCEITPYNNNQPSITQLLLSGRPNIKSLPRQIGLLTRITRLTIWEFEDLEEIPDWICDLSSLVSLSIIDCGKLKSLPSKEALQRLPKLNRLCISRCPMLKERYAKDHGPEWHTISHINFIDIDSEIIQ